MGELIQISDTVRIESGPARRKQTATEEVYKARKAQLKGAPGVGGGVAVSREPKDSAGKDIKVGEQMEYIDWPGPWGWYVYQLQEVVIQKYNPDTGEPLPPIKEERYMPVGFHEGEDAKAKAKAHAEGL